MRELKLTLSEISKRVEMGGQFTKEEADNILKKEKGGTRYFRMDETFKTI